ncbi:MAG: hypothetical protein OEY01_08005 [Desulfobulbaceae bacterium]|nr:hypothetical protein [Desulfobulbaceae bacterium]
MIKELFKKIILISSAGRDTRSRRIPLRPQLGAQAIKKYALLLLLLVNLALLTACTGQPSEKTIKAGVEHLIEMEGGTNIRFDVFQIEAVAPKVPDSCMEWRVSVKIAGTFNLHPYLANKKYKFNTVREYEFFRNGDGWNSFVLSMTPLHLAEGSSEITGEQLDSP